MSHIYISIPFQPVSNARYGATRKSNAPDSIISMSEEEKPREVHREGNDGSEYTGGWLNGKAHGKGKYKWADGKQQRDVAARPKPGLLKQGTHKRKSQGEATAGTKP